MVQYRHILVRMRLGESDRQIAAAGLMGRRTASKLRQKATLAGWLDLTRELPSDQALFEVLQQPKRVQACAQSSLEPYRETLEAWHTEGIQGTTIYQALQRLAMLMAWWPFLLLLLAAAWGDGWVRRRIRQSGFAYASPLAHAYALRGIVVVTVLLGLMLFLPVPLPVLGVPVVGVLVAALVGIAVANAQKRL